MGSQKRSRPLEQQVNDSSPMPSSARLSAKRRKVGGSGSSPSTPNTVESVKKTRGRALKAVDLKENEPIDDEAHREPSPTQQILNDEAAAQSTSPAPTAESAPGVALTSESEPTSRSAGRQKRKPRQYSTEVAETEVPERLVLEPKSILTPSKRGRGRPRKSVAFEQATPAEGEVDLGFKDIPIDLPPPDETTPVEDAPVEDAPVETSSAEAPSVKAPSVETTTPQKRGRGRPRKIRDPQELSQPKIVVTADASEEPAPPKRGRGRPRKVHDPDEFSEKATKSPRSYNKIPIIIEPDEEEEEDEEVCAICESGESEAPNEIMFCDNCDLAVHQDCYNIITVPEGEWLCSDCQPEDPALDTADVQEAASEIASESIFDIGGSEPPAIPGLEDHLMAMQRLLLDKLTGRTRLKLHDLDDEFQKVHQVVEQTVVSGEGNSMLVIGARGSGKTTVGIPRCLVLTLLTSSPARRKGYIRSLC